MPKKKNNKKRKKNKKKNKNLFKNEDEKDLNNTIINNSYMTENNNIDFDKDNKIKLNYSYDLSIKDDKPNSKDNKKKELKNNSYKLLKVKNDLKIYKYSNTQKKIYHNLIYQYFFDEFKDIDYKNAYIAIFIGKKGDGKRSTINSLFNVIKGINQDYNYRFILIEEQNQEKDLENGLHLCYIKGVNNKPIIIINCQGYGDIRGKEYDEEINNAFIYVFTNLIQHINLLCFIGKESYGKLDIFTRYIFNIAISLFTEDVIDNFIVIVTHSNKYLIKNGWSNFIGSLKDDINFDDIKGKLGNKWKYFLDNQSIFEDEINELTTYSFEKLNEIYNEKILNSNQKNTENFPKIINYRNEINTSIKNIVSTFKNLKKENNKIPSFERKIKEYDNKIAKVNNEIANKEYNINNINSYINSYNNDLYCLESEHNDKMYNLDNQYESITNRVLESSYCEHTYCNECKKNCHEYCNCFSFFVNRCTVFSIFGDSCEKCGHTKSRHSYHSYYRYVDKYERRKIPNYEKKNEENNRYNKKKSEINNNISRKRYERDNYYKEKNNLNNEKNNLQNSKNYYINEKDRIQAYMKKLSGEIYSIINKLIDIDRNIKSEGMNKFHIGIEREYINELIKEAKNNGNNESDKIKQLEELKENIKIYDELTSNYLYLFGFKMYSK